MGRPSKGGRGAAIIRQRRKALAENEIGELVYRWGRYSDGRPKPRNRKRWMSCKRDLGRFLKTYMGQAFPLAWSADHREAISRLAYSIQHGGLRAIAMPRGNGKTTICEGATIWAVAYGYRKYPVVVGATKDAAESVLASIKREIEDNPLMAEDFPAMAVPVSCLDGKPIRGKAQLCDGKYTRVGIKADRIEFASVKSDSCGALIQALALTGNLRGARRKMSDGSVQRPDFALLDDPQTDESAASPTQTETRDRLVSGAILGLSGPDVEMAAVMACTVIEPDDLSERTLDRPEWHGIRTSLVIEWPDAGLPDEKPDPKNGRPASALLWAEYSRIRKAAMLDGAEGSDAATEYYRANRAAMDKGAVLSWPERYSPGQLSGLQYAMDLYLDRGVRVFFSEFQNDPRSAQKKQVYNLTAERVRNNLAGTDVRTTDEHAAFVSCFADINHYGIHWAMIAAAGDMTGTVIDYGRYPERGRLVPKGANKSEVARCVYQGLGVLGKAFADFHIPRPGGRQGLDLWTIDAGYEMDTVFKFCRSPLAEGLPFRVLPSRGIASERFRESRAIGSPREHCHLAAIKRGQWVEHDADWWRMETQKAFLTDAGGPGALSLWGNDADRHESYSQHMVAEYLREHMIGEIRDFYVWGHVPGGIWDWLDATVGAWVGCCMIGGQFGSDSPPPKAKGAGRKRLRRKAIPR